MYDKTAAKVQWLKHWARLVPSQLCRTSTTHWCTRKGTCHKCSSP